MVTQLDLPVHYIQFGVKFDDNGNVVSDELAPLPCCECETPCVLTRTQERVTCEDCMDYAEIRRKK